MDKIYQFLGEFDSSKLEELTVQDPDWVLAHFKHDNWGTLTSREHYEQSKRLDKEFKELEASLTFGKKPT
jgi:hypothetical protein